MKDLVLGRFGFLFRAEESGYCCLRDRFPVVLRGSFREASRDWRGAVNHTNYLETNVWKLEHGFETIHAGIPYTSADWHEDSDVPTFNPQNLKASSKQTSGPGLRARASRGSCATQNFHRLRLPSSYVVAIRRI